MPPRGSVARHPQSSEDAPSQHEMPEKRTIPPPPPGKLTQEQGEEYCRLICSYYPEVFDGQKGTFKGAEATIHIKDGHRELIKKSGLRPPAKMPYGLEDQYEVLLDALYEDLIPIDGHKLITESQLVPVCVSVVWT